MCPKASYFPASGNFVKDFTPTNQIVSICNMFPHHDSIESS